jgi:AcrR family transcriptional regulator
MPKSPLDTKARILKTALLLFLEKGYKNISYQDLVKNTGLSKGAIYHYFASKKDLLLAVFDLFSAGSGQPTDKKPEDIVTDHTSFRKFYIDTRMKQLKAFKAFLGTGIANFNWVLFCLESIEANAELKGTISAIAKTEVDFLEKCFTGLQKNGNMPKGKDPALLAQNLYYVIEGAGLVMFLTEDKRDEDFIKLFDKTLDNFFKII